MKKRLCALLSILLAFGMFALPVSAAEEASANEAWVEKAKLLAAGAYSSAWVQEDGTVTLLTKFTDNDRKTNNWKNVKQIAAYDYIVGLLENGKVVISNITPHHERLSYINPSTVNSWTNIVDIDVDEFNAVGLTSRGTVVVSNGNGETSAWANIKDVAVNATNVYGLKGNGTVVVSGDHNAKQAKVSGWNNIVAIDAGYLHVVGLKSDGTVVAKGTYGCDVEFWDDIVAVSAGAYHTVGLRSDGTVIATMMDGGEDYGQCNVGGWTDVVAISAGLYHTIAMQSDGTILAVGNNAHSQCEVND